MPTIRLLSRATVRQTAWIGITDEEMEKLKADPEIVPDELADKYQPVWTSGDWEDITITGATDEDGNLIE